MTRTELRKELRARYGKRNYQITEGGQVIVYGVRPHTNKTGWYFLGFENEVKAKIEAEKEAEAAFDKKTRVIRY